MSDQEAKQFGRQSLKTFFSEQVLADVELKATLANRDHRAPIVEVTGPGRISYIWPADHREDLAEYYGPWPVEGGWFGPWPVALPSIVPEALETKWQDRLHRIMKARSSNHPERVKQQKIMDETDRWAVPTKDGVGVNGQFVAIVEARIRPAFSMLAIRRDGPGEFYGFASRGAGGGGHSIWTMSTLLGSFGGDWPTGEEPLEPFGEPYREALATYVDLLRAVAPPDQGTISFAELMRDFRKGRVGMIVEVGMEYAYLLRDDPALAERSGVALVPAGPAGRSPNLYTPPWAIPAKSEVHNEAWELAKFLTSPRQLLEDGLLADAIETSSMSVLYSPEFDGHFRADLLGAVRASRAIAFEERPFGTLGIDACVVIGNAVNAAIMRAVSINEALAQMHSGLMALRSA